MAQDESIPGRSTRDSKSVFSRYQAEYEDLVEVGFDGHSTDVELEVTEDGGDDRITAPFDPDRIDIQTRNTTVDLLLSRLQQDMIDLAPDFQRKAGIWTDDRQSRLIESLLLRIPIPSFYAAEQHNGEWAIVDGIQRLTAITRFIAHGAIGATPLRLTGLEYLSGFDGMEYGDLSGRLQIRLRETEVVVHLIRRGTPEEVMFNIFARINTGGLPLTRQEIRHALIPGRARGVLAELADSEPFLLATGGTVSGERMADREMVLRFLAFRMTPPGGFRQQDFDAFLAASMRAVNKWSTGEEADHRAAFARAMGVAQSLFGRSGFRKQRRGQTRRSPINKALFEAMSVTFAGLSPDQTELLASRADDVVESFHDLMNDIEFERSISVGTGDPAKVRYRFDAINKLVQGVLASA
ncbi:DUF262 domain-containing protein [Streptomyces sp. NPDC101169]|uniref:DUF262 domain-containing protein n=1 Tax=Streptomyces sp. NPDC101169 TaxID=3366121 RepID=UPI003820E693